MEQQPTILIVDDDREIRTLPADYLESHAYASHVWQPMVKLMVDFGQTQNRSIGTLDLNSAR